MTGPVGVLLMLPSQSCVQAQVPVKATSWGPPPNSFLGMLVCSLDKSSLHPKGQVPRRNQLHHTQQGQVVHR
jgi:hypothetical protein